MKNIERPEVILPMFKFLTDKSYGTAYLLEDLYKLGMPDDIYKRADWLDSEYVEPHKWEPWELEVLRHIPKRYLYIAKKYENVLPRLLKDEEKYSSMSDTLKLEMKSIHSEEVINIDEELERNGMH